MYVCMSIPLHFSCQLIFILIFLILVQLWLLLHSTLCDTQRFLIQQNRLGKSVVEKENKRINSVAIFVAALELFCSPFQFVCQPV